MDKQIDHIVKWVKSKGIKIVNSDKSYFDHSEPNTIFIEKNTPHGLAASILHEYYHSRQLRRRKSRKHREIIEYRAEVFVIRCCKKLDITYDKTFVEHYWQDRPPHDVSWYYIKAYKLLVKNKVL